MRLIDADAFKEQVVGAALINGISEAGEKAETMVKLIDSQPTAYDVDKVEQELRSPNNYTIIAGKHYTTVERAVDIVRSGGIAPEGECTALDKMYCREGECRFYKSRDDVRGDNNESEEKI